FGSLTVRENVELAAEAAHVGDDPLTQLGIVGGRGKVRKEVKAIADELIHDTGLEPIHDRLASEISAGQGRLVELAWALARGANQRGGAGRLPGPGRCGIGTRSPTRSTTAAGRTRSGRRSTPPRRCPACRRRSTGAGSAIRLSGPSGGRSSTWGSSTRRRRWC